MKKRTVISLLLTAGAMVGMYKLWHHSSVLIFISLLILSFLLAYKLTDYIADFKTAKQQSRIEIIFLTVFFILLFIPMSYINPSEKSKTENRYLATLKPFIIQNQINYDFGKNFNEFFSDRFAMRSELIKTSNILHCVINKNYCSQGNRTLYKKYNLVVFDNMFGMYKHQADDIVLQKYKQNLDRFNDYCKSKNIKLYILIVPRQSDFIHNIKDVNYQKLSALPDRSEVIINYLKENTDLKIIYPKKEMLEVNKTLPVYYRTDSHWTHKGAYVGYYELMKAIKQDFPQVNILDEKSLTPYYSKMVKTHWNKKMHVGDGLQYLGLPKSMAERQLKINYLYYDSPDKNLLKSGNLSNFDFVKYRDIEVYYPKGANLKTLLVCNSFGGNLMEFLPYSFRYTFHVRDNDRRLKFSEYENIIEEYKPNIIVLNFHGLYLNHVLSMYEN